MGEGPWEAAEQLQREVGKMILGVLPANELFWATSVGGSSRLDGTKRD